MPLTVDILQLLKNAKCTLCGYQVYASCFMNDKYAAILMLNTDNQLPNVKMHDTNKLLSFFNVTSYAWPEKN